MTKKQQGTRKPSTQGKNCFLLFVKAGTKPNFKSRTIVSNAALQQLSVDVQHLI